MIFFRRVVAAWARSRSGWGQAAKISAVVFALVTVDAQAEITTTVFTGTSSIIEWADSGASRYFLYVGTSTGGSEIFSGEISGFMQVLDNLPADGTTLYVTFWELTNRWRSTDSEIVSDATNDGSGGIDSQLITELLESSQTIENLAFAGLLMLSGVLGISAGLKR